MKLPVVVCLRPFGSGCRKLPIGVCPPASLPGVPLDETYLPLVAEVLPVAEAVIPIGNDETPDLSAESAVEETDDVKNVLDGMFALFKEPAKTTGVKRITPGRVSQVKAAGRVLKLPSSNTEVEKKQNFLEKLFSPRKREQKKKVKKGLFDF